MTEVNFKRKIADFNEFVDVFVNSKKDYDKKSFYAENSDDKIIISHCVDDTEILLIDKSDIYSDTEIIDLIEYKQDEILNAVKNSEITDDCKRLLNSIYTAIYNG